MTKTNRPQPPRTVVHMWHDGEHLMRLSGDSIRGVHRGGDPEYLPPAWHSGFLLDDVGAYFRAAGEGTFIVDRPPTEVFDDGDTKRQLADFATMAKESGWTAAAGLELGSGWITWTKPEHPTVHMGITHLMHTEDPASPILVRINPQAVVERLARYAGLVGAAYRATPGVSGLGALRNLYDTPRVVRRPQQSVRIVRREQPKWTWNPPGEALQGCGDLVWQRQPSLAERETFPFVRAFDVRAMYLAAAAGAALGFDAPRHTGAIMWDPALSGLFRVRVRGYEWADSRYGPPIINPNRVNSDGTTWVTGPILAYLSERGDALPEILDSFTCPKSGRYLEGWANQIRDALPEYKTAGDIHLRGMIKRTYVETIGLLARPGGRAYRRDWAATIIDEARVRIHRKINDMHAQRGCWPLKIKTDCVWYAAMTGEVDHLILDQLGTRADNRHFIGIFLPDPENHTTMTNYLAGNRPKTGSKR